jgi:hypothetical protein
VAHEHLRPLQVFRGTVNSVPGRLDLESVDAS